MTTQQTDADLIREVNIAAALLMGLDAEVAATLRRAAARIAELAQPAPQQPDDLEAVIDAYVEDYELTGDEGSYTPTERERIVIKDAIMGLLADTDWDAAWGRVIDEQATRKAAQPAPLALSPEDAKAWASIVQICRKAATSPRSVEPEAHATLAVDALLRQRVQRLTDEQIKGMWLGCKSIDNGAFATEFARAVEAKLIGDAA